MRLGFHLKNMWLVLQLRDKVLDSKLVCCLSDKVMVYTDLYQLDISISDD